MKKEFIDRQEKFAKDNYAGLEETAQSMLEKIETLKEMWAVSSKIRETATEEEWDAAYDEFQNIGDSLNTDMMIVGIKLSNTVGHALNAKSTKMIKKVIKFLDTYGLNDKFIHDGLMKIASKRNTNGDILDMALVVAAQHNDIAFTKYVYKFMEKNKDRENIYDTIGVPNALKDAGDMQDMTKLYKKERIAFEALINSSKDVYYFITDNKGLSHDYIMNYINSDYYVSRLTPEEVKHVIVIHPEVIDDIIEYMPENVPSELQDIFLF